MDATAETKPSTECAAARKPLTFDNREAMAYVVFREFNCSRGRALEVVDEMLTVVPSLRVPAAPAWRQRRR